MPRRRNLIDINAAAELLGTTVRHMRGLVADRRITYVKVGHLIRFDPDDLDEWIDAHKRRAVRDLPRKYPQRSHPAARVVPIPRRQETKR